MRKGGGREGGGWEKEGRENKGGRRVTGAWREREAREKAGRRKGEEEGSVIAHR